MRREHIVAKVKTYLDQLPVGQMVSTNTLAANVVAASDAFDGKQYVRLVYDTLSRERTGELLDYNTAQKPRLGKGLNKGKMVVPRLWHRPIPFVECPHCHGLGKLRETGTS